MQHSEGILFPYFKKLSFILVLFVFSKNGLGYRMLLLCFKDRLDFIKCKKSLNFKLIMHIVFSDSNKTWYLDHPFLTGLSNFLHSQKVKCNFEKRPRKTRPWVGCCCRFCYYFCCSC